MRCDTVEVNVVEVEHCTARQTGDVIGRPRALDGGEFRLNGTGSQSFYARFVHKRLEVRTCFTFQIRGLMADVGSRLREEIMEP